MNLQALGFTLPLAPEHGARVLIAALRLLGGKGSGHFGHAGRPGEVGGSAVFPSGRVAEWIKKARDQGADADYVAWIRQSARRMHETADQRSPAANKVLVELTEVGGWGATFDQEDPDLPLIVKRGETFSTSGLLMKKGEPHQCHTNVSKLWKSRNVDDIATGYGLADDGMWRQHTWGLKENTIVETTARFTAYYGVRLTEREALRFARAQGVR